MTTLQGIDETLALELGKRPIFALIEECGPSVVSRFEAIDARLDNARLIGDLKRIDRARTKGTAA